MHTAINWDDIPTVLTIASILAGSLWAIVVYVAKKDKEHAAEIARVNQALYDFKIEVARKYVSTESMRELEDRLISSIDRLGDRLDKVFSARGLVAG